MALKRWRMMFGVRMLELRTWWVFDPRSGECLGCIRNQAQRTWYVAKFNADGLLEDRGAFPSRKHAVQHLTDKD